jgi:hypothetical protein
MGAVGTGSGSCQVAGFGISGDESSGSATRELVNGEMDLREIGCEDGSGWNWLRIVSSGRVW